MEKKRRGGPVATVTVAAVAVLMLLNLGPGGFGDGSGSGTGNAASPTTAVQAVQTEAPARHETQPQTAAETEPEKQVILVTISENDYLCDNRKYTLEALLAYLTGLDGDILVEIREDNASLRASRDLTDSLTEHGILFAQQQ